MTEYKDKGTFWKDDCDEPRWLRLIVAVCLAIIVVIAVCMAVFPKYGVWQKELAGKADLKEAEWNKKIAIEEAKAELDSAEYKKKAEIVRADGIAEANRIIAGSITPEYLKYKFIEGLNDGNTEVIYVPTEANLPILEAGKYRLEQG